MSRFRIGLYGCILIFCLILLAGCSRITPTPVATPQATSAARTELVQAPPAPTQVATDKPEPTLSPTVTSSPVPTSTPIPPTAIPSPTALPIIETPPATPMATDPLDTGVYAVILKNPVNLRGGPDTGYEIIGEVISGQRYPALARSENSDWWLIDANGTPGWVSASLVNIEGDGESLPIVKEETQAVAPSGVQVYETTLSIPTYPYAAFTDEVTSAEHGWTYRRFNRAAYEASNPQPLPWSYTAVVLENELLRITMLPDLGGRVYQVIFKPTGNNEMYENPVIKPSPWGPPEQGGWLAAGGIEWGLPVEEHGYVWGDPWGHITVPYDETRTGVTLFMPNQEDHLRAEVDVILRSGEAAFTLQPRITNPTIRPRIISFGSTRCWRPALPIDREPTSVLSCQPSRSPCTAEATPACPNRKRRWHGRFTPVGTAAGSATGPSFSVSSSGPLPMGPLRPCTMKTPTRALCASFRRPPRAAVRCSPWVGRPRPARTTTPTTARPTSSCTGA